MDNFKNINTSLDKLNPKTLDFFGSQEKVKEFLGYVCNTSSIALSGDKMGLNSFMLYGIVQSDQLLNQAVKVAKEYSAEIAEGILYERAVYGYDEEIYDVEEQKIKRVHKYSDGALRDFLRANNPKYRTKSNGQVAGNATKDNDPMQLELLRFEEKPTPERQNDN